MSLQHHGLGMPRPPKTHQELLYSIAHNINEMFWDAGFEALPEVRAEEDYFNSLSPDVGVYFKGKKDPVIAIEVSGNKDSASRFKSKKLPAYTSSHQVGLFRFVELFHVKLYSNRVDQYRFSVKHRLTPRQDLLNQSMSELLQFDIRELCLHHRDFKAKYRS